MLVVSLHCLSRDGLSEWLASVQSVRGAPDHAPEPVPLPSAAEVLDAFRSAGCHGTNWFRLLGEEAGSRLPECPDAGTCASLGGHDLGEVSVYCAGGTSSLQPIPADAAVETVSFRKPSAAAVLRAVCALAPIAGPQLVFDDSAAAAFVVWPDEHADALMNDWPW
nr:hypothetical protein GCM10020063_021860 [Dactylosporangium thailandense]